MQMEIDAIKEFQVTVGFSTQRGPVAALVRWLTRSKANHCWMSLDLKGLPIIVEAAVGGVKIVDRARWSRSNKVVGEFVPLNDVDEGVYEMFSHVGKSYDYSAFFGFIPVIIASRWFKKKIKNPLASPQELICSEFLTLLRTGGGIPEWDHLDPETTTPEDLLKICKREESFTRIA